MRFKVIVKRNAFRVVIDYGKPVFMSPEPGIAVEEASGMGMIVFGHDGGMKGAACELPVRDQLAQRCLTGLTEPDDQAFKIIQCKGLAVKGHRFKRGAVMDHQPCQHIRFFDGNNAGKAACSPDRMVLRSSSPEDSSVRMALS